MRGVLLFALLIVPHLVGHSAEVVGPYLCTTTDNGKLMVGPYTCGVSQDGKATIATVTVAIAKVSQLNTNTYRIVLNLTPTGVGKVAIFPAGSVPAGTVCDLSQKLTLSGIEYYRVDRNTPGLTWSGNNQPPVVWAQCQ